MTTKSREVGDSMGVKWVEGGEKSAEGVKENTFSVKCAVILRTD